MRTIYKNTLLEYDPERKLGEWGGGGGREREREGEREGGREGGGVEWREERRERGGRMSG